MTTRDGARVPGHASAGGYDLVLGLLVVSMVVGALLPDRMSALVSATVGVVLWLAVARAAGLRRRAALGGVAGLLAIVVFAAATYTAEMSVLAATSDMLLAVAVATVAAVIARALLRERVVTLATVAAVLCLYLMIGLFFAYAYLAVLGLDDGAFVGTGVDPDRFSLIYFSFIALTTVGFGDITPVNDVARALAATEAVTGQLFLVTVVARVVSLIGRERLKRER
jgi:hypothetical protein